MTPRFHGSGADGDAGDRLAAQFVPPPLRTRLPEPIYYPPRRVSTHRLESAPLESQRPAPHNLNYYTAQHTRGFAIDDVEMSHYHVDNDLNPRPPPYGTDHEREIAPPPRTFRSSMRRISLTPGEMPYPIGLLRPEGPTDYTRTEQMLGLRRASRPPPVPPKSPWRPDEPTSTVLPMHRVLLARPEADPLNGRTAWLHAVTASLVVFNCWGMANAFGLFQAYYGTYRLPSTNPSAIAWIGSTQLALVFGLGLPVGRLVDRGYFRLMFHGGSLLMLLGLFCTAWCEKLWTLWLVQGLVTGFGMGMVFCAGIIALMTWFDETKIGIAMGLGAAGSCFGGIVYVLLARHFLQTNGFATTMRILAGVATFTMIPPNLVFRMRGQKHKSTSVHRSVTGQTTANVRRAVTIRDFIAPAYLLAAAGMFFAFLGVYFGFVYMVSFASTVLKLSDTVSTNLLIAMLAANLPGRFVPALISDRCIGPLNTIIPSIFLSAAVIGLWAATSHSPTSLSLTVIACFLGFASAGVQVLYAPTVYTFCLEPTRAEKSTATTDSTQLAMDRMGVKAGGIFSCIGLACLISTPIGGALVDYRTSRGLSQPYLGAQIFAACSLLLGGMLLLASRVAKIGWQAGRA